MKLNKIFTFKNIMFVMCVGIAIISTFFSCEVRAVSSSIKLEKIDISSSSSKSDIFDIVWQHFNIQQNTIYGSSDQNNFNNLKNSFINSEYSAISYYYSTNAGSAQAQQVRIFGCNSIDNWFVNGDSYSITGSVSNRGTYGTAFKTFVNYSSSITWTTNFTDNNITDYYCLSQNRNGEWLEVTNTNFHISNFLVPPFDFIPYGFQLSGDSAAYWNKFAYVSGFIPLGVLGDNSYYQLDIKLRNSNGYDVGSYSDVPGVGSISDDNGKILNVDNNGVFVNSIYLSYYQNYNLLFKVWSDSNNFETFVYSYKFMPFSAVIEDGQIVSSGDTTFSGVDSTILINENLNDWSQIGLIMRQFGSGDFIVSGDDFIVSGDLFTLLGYSDYNNSYKDFIYSGVYHNLKDVFLSSNDREFSFLFMGKNMTINSNQFVTPNGVLKTFVSSFLVFGTFYYFYKTVIHGYHKMQEGNQLEAIETWSIDDESILM